MNDNANNANLLFSLDTSTLKPKDISATEFGSDLTERLQRILDKEFGSVYEKRHIKKTQVGLNFACPFCHDSAIDYKKKRAHLLLEGRFAGQFKCHNCGKSMRISRFFNTFDVPLSISDLSYIRNHVQGEQTGWGMMQSGNMVTSEIIDKSEVEQYALDRNFLRDILGLDEITQHGTPYAWKYLTGRCQYTMNRFLYSKKYNQIIILNLVGPDKVFGFQTRNIGKGGGRYLTMSLSKMRERILRDSEPIPPHIENLSTVFNIFNVDIYKPILVTEGPFDAFLLPNCIATSGASKNIGVELPFWYVYDSDKTGLEHALAKLRQGYNVFKWKELKRDLGLPNRMKWDISDVMVWLRQNNPQYTIQWSKYFTSNPLDGLSL